MITKPSRRERKREEVRRRLYEAAWSLFEKNGFEETTVEHITEKADYAKGTFFNHFPTKESILQAYYDELVTASLANLESIVERGGTAEERLRDHLRRGAHLVEGEGRRHRILLDRWLQSPRLLAQDGETGAEFAERYQGIFQDGIDAGELDPDLNVAAAVAVFRSLWSSGLAEWAMFGSAEGTLAGILEAKLGVVLKGVLAR